MEVLTLLLLTLPSCWSMPTEWSEWSPVGSQDGSDALPPPGDSGDIVEDLIDGVPDDGLAAPGDFVDDLIDSVPDGGLAAPGYFAGLGPIGGLGLLGGGAALATIAGVAASTGLVMKLGWAKVAIGDLLVKNEDETSDVLLPGDGLDKMGKLLSENGMFKLLLEEGGNLVISGKTRGFLEGKDKYKVVWSTKTAGSGNTYFKFQEDGDLVVLNGANSVIWNSGTRGLGGKILQMTNAGFLVLFGSNDEQIWESSPHTLITGQNLHAGYGLTSSNGNFELRIQGWADFGVYWVSGDSSAVIWRAEASGASYLSLQSDGNLVLFNSIDEAQWESNTKGSKAQSLVLKDDGMLELCCKKDGGTIWNNYDGVDRKPQAKFSVLANLETPEMIIPTVVQSLMEVSPEEIEMVIQDMKSQEVKVIQDMKSQEAKVIQDMKSQEAKVIQDMKSQEAKVIQDMKSQEANFEDLRDGKQHVSNGWTVWSEFTACSATCGPATKMRERVCTDTTNYETMCQGPTAEIFNCYFPICGGWSAWSDFIECSATCGPALKTRRRTCTDNSNGGLNCLGSSEETIDCDHTACPEALQFPGIDGGWSAWSDFTTCSASCGSATKSRVRTCSDLEPTNGDQMCLGLKEEIADCNLPDCQVIDGEWSAWSDFGTCSATCGPATKRRERTCTDQETSEEGLVCQGPQENVVDCNLSDCPIDGGWAAWSDFSTCSATCGLATKRRERTCTDTELSNGGILCQGPNEETSNCALANCAIDGGWSAWSDFGTCSATCGMATKRRARTCTEPEPSDGGQLCQGLKEEVTYCNFVFC